MVPLPQANIDSNDPANITANTWNFEPKPFDTDVDASVDVLISGLFMI